MSTPSHPGSGPELSKDKTGAGERSTGDRGSGPASSPGGPPPWARGGPNGRGTAVVDAPTSHIRRDDLPSDMPDLSETRRSAPEGTHPPEPQPSARGGSRGTRGGPRRAALQLKRFDPWSVFKLSVVLAVALFLIWMIAVGVLYLVLDGMGVWSRINTTFSDFVTVSNPGGTTELIGPGRVFGVAAVIGLVNVLLFSAIATVSAFVYNLSSDLVGGFEVTLTERD